jgi:putative alpha-1,2-mannosidase
VKKLKFIACLTTATLTLSLCLFVLGCASHRPPGCANAAPATGTPLFALPDPMQGTDSQRSFSHGNEYPAIALPFPMNIWAPYTQPQSDPFYYAYRQTRSAASGRRTSLVLGSATTPIFH